MSADMKRRLALVVDDVEMNRIICEEMLLALNVSSVQAGSGEQALAAFEDHEFDIVFLDHIMPGMNGVELCRRIRAMKGTELPVVVLTGNDVEEYEKEYADAGMSGWLTKPIGHEDLARVLSELLNVEMGEGEKVTAPEETERKLLRAFVIQVRDKLPLMEVCIAEERQEGYMLEAHSFKSSLVNAGARELSGAARELEMAAKRGDFETIREKHPAFAEAVAAYTRTVSEKLEKSGTSAERPQGDYGELAEKLKSAKAAMDDFDTKEAAKIINGLTKKTYSPYDDDITELDALFDTYAFDKIDGMLSALIPAAEHMEGEKK